MGSQSHKLRFTEIDLLRFLAALSIVFFHYTFRGAARGHLCAVGFPSLAPLFKYGYLGVHLFFIISGFVILMTAIDRTPKQFIISRMTRLYPTFWACCSLTFLVLCLWGPRHLTLSFWQYLANLTLMHYFFNIPSVDGVYWSLFFEIVFYFYIFLLISTRQIGHIEYYLGFWLAGSILLLKYHVKIMNFLFIPEYSAYFIGGCLFYLICQKGINLYRGLLLIGDYIFAMASLVKDVGQMDTIYSGYYFDITVPFVSVTIFYLIFLLIACHKTTFLRWDGFLFLGSLTYPLYLIHQYIGYMVLNAFYSVVNPKILLIETIALMLFLAYLVHVGIEERWAPVFKRFLEKQLK